jgi:hypothetical protein
MAPPSSRHFLESSLQVKGQQHLPGDWFLLKSVLSFCACSLFFTFACVPIAVLLYFMLASLNSTCYTMC